MRSFRAIVVLGGVILVGSVGALACSSFTASDDTAGPDATSADDATNEPTDAPDAEDAADDDGFPRSRLVNVVTGVGGYSIEATEVTVAQFRAFKIVYGLDAGAPWPQCKGKTALGPPGGCGGATTADVDAVTCIDWCDAYSYCAAIGRRLCGAIGDGGVSTNGASITNDEWAHACGGERGTPWPYGTTAMPDACATMDNSPRPMAVGAPAIHPECQGGPAGGVAGVFDMSGNAAEWSNACGSDSCTIHGGSYENLASVARCDDVLLSGPGGSFHDVGFRCCAGPTP